jgi:hypothetical protein
VWLGGLRLRQYVWRRRDLQSSRCSIVWRLVSLRWPSSRSDYRGCTGRLASCDRAERVVDAAQEVVPGDACRGCGRLSPDVRRPRFDSGKAWEGCHVEWPARTRDAAVRILRTARERSGSSRLEGTGRRILTAALPAVVDLRCGDALRVATRIVENVRMFCPSVSRLTNGRNYGQASGIFYRTLILLRLAGAICLPPISSSHRMLEPWQ